ncbi:MAG: NAD-dependent epimerase/dehydratase family protein [Bryobacteraceae bacterium]
MPTLERDLQHVLAHTHGVWDEFSGASIFITGGTGFFGKWLLESFIAANQRHRLNARAVVLTRDATHGISSNPAISFHTGDIRSFEFPEGSFSHVIHAATPSTGPAEMLDTIIQGTRRVLDFARCCSAKKLLFCSSGAVYGRQPPTLDRVPEDYNGAPDCLDPRSAYGEGKRAAELLCAAYERDHGIQVKIARCFAFLGPHLPLDAHFAAGNFLRDAMSGQPICIQGDGTPYRSYLYTADLMIWLWTILAKGEAGRAYNVGSEVAINIASLATTMVDVLAPGTPIQVMGAPVPGRLPERYVPCTARARSELKLEQYIDLADAIRRTADWYRQPSE